MVVVALVTTVWYSSQVIQRNMTRITHFVRTAPPSWHRQSRADGPRQSCSKKHRDGMGAAAKQGGDDISARSPCLPSRTGPYAPVSQLPYDKQYKKYFHIPVIHSTRTGNFFYFLFFKTFPNLDRNTKTLITIEIKIDSYQANFFVVTLNIFAMHLIKLHFPSNM